MLHALTIENYALIDALQIEFHPGFSIITGETGAGKSILLGALGLLTGQRADTSVMLDPERKCIVEASFKLAGYQLETLFQELDLDYEPLTTIRRIIAPTGKSRAFVNDVPVSLQQLRQLSPALIDIHSQHENLLLGQESFQLRIVDSYAQTQDLLENYRQHYRAYQHTQAQLDTLRQTASEAQREHDYIAHQYTELQQAELQAHELPKLEQEQEALAHTEDIQEALALCQNTLATDETGTNAQLVTLMQGLRRIAPYYPKADEYLKRIETTYYELKDIAEENETLLETLEHDPARLQYLEQRLALYFELQKKHRCDSPEALIALRDSYAQKLEAMAHFDDEIAALEQQLTQHHKALLAQAQKLSKARTKALPQIQTYVNTQLAQLGMPNGQLHIAHKPLSQPAPHGTDDISFHFSANKNSPAQAIAKVASGGERSRVMLCLKSLLAQHSQLPTIIFDEIDTGVSGDIADKMGDIMQHMAQRMQVISITHLPQVAAKGQQHLRVYKHDTAHSTFSRIEVLPPQARIDEIAKMLSGRKLTEAALQNARDLLQHNNS